MVYFVVDNVVYMGAIHNRKNTQIDLICVVYSKNKQVRKNIIKSHRGPPLLDLLLVSSRRRLNNTKNTLIWKKNGLLKYKKPFWIDQLKKRHICTNVDQYQIYI